MEVRNLIPWLLATGGLVSCSRAPMPVVPSKPLPASTYNRLVVAATDYRTGLLSFVDLKRGQNSRRDFPIHSDAVVRSPVGSNQVYVINRLGQDNIEIIDKGTGAVKAQYAVGSNPQDIFVASSRVGYVSRLGEKTLLKLDLQSGQWLKEIGGFDADADGYPEMTWMEQAGGNLLVLLQRLDRRTLKPTDKSCLGVVDIGSDSVTRNIDLLRTNPVTEIRSFGDNLFIGEVGKYGQLDGAIERFDSVSLQSKGVISTEAQLGGDIVDFQILSESLGAAIVAIARGGKGVTMLVAFDPRTGQRTRIVLDPGTYTFQHLLWDRDRRLLYVADRDPHHPGVRVLGSEDLLERPDFHIALSLPPYFLNLTD